jgi:hypothetical protein
MFAETCEGVKRRITALNQHILQAGAGRRVITPPVGVAMAGWDFRAAGDNVARFVRDDLYVKALTVRRGDKAWALITADLVGVDAVATARIRRGVAQQTELLPETVLVCATHCHSGPAVCPVARAASPDVFSSTVVRADGKVGKAYGKESKVTPTAYYVGETDLIWKEQFITNAIEATVEAWQSQRPAEVAFGQTEVEGVASSRRVLLSDGTWADPRQEADPEAEIVSRTAIDPLVRVVLLRERETKAPLAAVINYGSHPWIFSGAGFSAEMAGATADRVAAAWAGSEAEPPVVLYTSGPEGDVTLIWNVDVEHIWETRPGETPEESLARRERGFDTELDRLSGRLAEGVMAAISGAGRWEPKPELDARRQEVALPLKSGYRRPAEVLVAEWQQAAPETHHLTEVQVLQVGEGALVGLPGEPFVSLGDAIRAGSPFRHLLIAALANDFGAISYIGDRAAYELGGYELTHTAVAAGAGEILVEQAVGLLNAKKPLMS